MGLLTYLVGLLKYARLKLKAIILRTQLYLHVGRIVARPDSVMYIPSRDAHRRIKAHVYNPPQTTTDESNPRPVLINLFGSGYVLPMHGSDDHYCRHIASHTPYTVLDIQYRLAPEHPFPAALDDTEDALTYVFAHPSRFDTSRVALSGFSAGASLTASAAAVLFPGSVRALISVYPAFDKTLVRGSVAPPDPSGKQEDPALGRFFDDAYIPEGQDKRDPRLSPCFADVGAFPPHVLVVTGARDYRALGGEAFAAKLKGGEDGRTEGERHVVVRRFEECAHGFDKWCTPGSAQEKARDEAYDMAVDLLSRALQDKDSRS